MFNVRVDAFWPWLYVKPPSDEPPGFRVADGPVRDTGVDDMGFVLPGYGSGINGAAPDEIGFGRAYRPGNDGNPFGFLDRRGPNAGSVPSFSGGSIPPYPTSLLFPQMAEPWRGLRGYGGDVDAQRNTRLPGFRVKPPADDPPGFRVAGDGSVGDARTGDVDFAFPGYGSGVSSAAPAGVGIGGTRRPASDSNPFGFLDRRIPDVGSVPSFHGRSLPPYATSLPYLRMAEPQFSWLGVHGYGSELGSQPDTPLPPIDDLPGLRVAADSSAHGTLPATPQIAPFEYGLHTDAASPIGTLRTPVREALDQIKKIHAGFGVSPNSLFDRQGSNTGSVMLRDGFGGGMAPAVGEVFDPQYILPAQTGGWRSPPNHNKPPPPPKPTPDSSRSQQPPPQRTLGTQPPPDTASAAAVADAATRERAAAFDIHRNHLQELDPDNPLLKLEPVPGVTPDQATVDSFGKEVERIVREKVERAVTDLGTQSTYEQRSTVKTVGNEVDLRAEFERLRSGGKRVDGGRGQYGREGELYELPGGVRVGFRMANDMRTGEKRSVPTLDIRYSDGTWVRFHYNKQR